MSPSQFHPLQLMRFIHSLGQSSRHLQSLECTAGCAKKIYKEGGLAALFKGNFATMVKVAPQTAIQFAVSLLTRRPLALR